MTVVRVRAWGGQMIDAEEWESRALYLSIRGISVGLRSTCLVFLGSQCRLSQEPASPIESATVAAYGRMGVDE